MSICGVIQKSPWKGLAVLVSTVGVLGAASTSASGLLVHQYMSQIPIAGPVAVGSNGDFYVEQESGEVLVFNSEDVELRALPTGSSEIPAEINHNQLLAVGPLGEKYTATRGSSQYAIGGNVAESNAEGIPGDERQIAAVEEREIGSIAVEGSTGNLYVLEENGFGCSVASTCVPYGVVVYEYNKGGVLIAEISELETPQGVIKTRGSFGPRGEKPGAVDLALGPNGYIYVSSRWILAGMAEPPVSMLNIFGPGLELPVAVTGPHREVGSTCATVEGAVNPEGIDATSRFDFGPTSAYGLVVSAVQAEAGPHRGSLDDGSGSTPVSVQAELCGLEPRTFYHYRLDGVNGNGVGTQAADETFETKPSAPSLDSVSSSAVTQTSAIINAHINPNNEASHYLIEYGAGAGYEASVPIADSDIGSGYGDVGIGQLVTGLQPDTAYHFRVAAENATGHMEGTGEFTTALPLQAPGVTTGAVSEVSAGGVRLSGAVETRGVQTTYEFDLGTDTSYGARIFGNAGATVGPQEFTTAVGSLLAGTTYHYRMVATNVYGTSYGVDQQFTTPAVPSSLIVAPASAPLVGTPSLQFPAQTTGTSSSTAKHAKGKAKKRARKQTRKKRVRKSAPSSKRSSR